MRSHKDRISFLAIVVGVMLLLLPPMFQQRRSDPDVIPGDWWADFLLDYQTLIAGVLAVAAAWATVRQMQKTDKETAVRHEQMFRLQLRPDKHRFDRMYLPQRLELGFHVETIPVNRQVSQISSEDKLTAEKPQELLRRAQIASKKLAKIEEILGRNPWREGLVLLDGPATFHHEKLLELTTKCKGYVFGIMRIYGARKRFPNSPLGSDAKGLSSLAEKMDPVLDDIKMHLEQLVLCLDILARDYDPDREDIPVP